MRAFLLPNAALVAALAGCASQPATDTADLTWMDRDKDGFSEDDGDCDDNNALINAAVLELCDGIDNNCNGVIDEDGAFDATAWHVDFDGDGHGARSAPVYACAAPVGYAANQTDCDDANAAAYPGGEEVCDLADNDCDGSIDEGTSIGAVTYYRDADQDGDGTRWDTLVACPPADGVPEGYSDNNLDCNDMRADVNVRADEVCDDIGTDEDCDGLIDDQDDSTVGRGRWFPDSDQDGYGDCDDPGQVTSCARPATFVATCDDCDEDDPMVNPGTAEICGNNTDDDCDGLVDNGDADIQWYADNDRDGYGDPASPGLQQCDQPTGQVKNSYDCDDTDINIFPGAVEIWYDGVDSNCDGASDYDADRDGYDAEAYGGDDCGDRQVAVNPGLPEICGDNLDNNCDDLIDTCEKGPRLLGEDTGRLGDAAAFVSDWDGDGDVDMLVGASRLDGGGNARGAVYMVLGPLSASKDVSAVDSLRLLGENDQDYLGITVVDLGDQDGRDGYGDVAMGAFGYDGPTGGLTEAGAVYVVNGPLQGSYDIDTVYDAMFYGEGARDWAGTALGTGDVNGDGYGDTIVGAYRHDPLSVSDAGAVYLLLGPVSTSAPRNLSHADTKLYATTAGEWAGYAVSGAGDVDGDGEDEVLVGAPQRSQTSRGYEGGVYVVSYNDSASMSLRFADATIVGESTSSFAGYAVAGVGDVNLDGYDDILVGAPEENTAGQSSGAAYLFHGPLSGTIYAATADATFSAESGDDYLGASVASAGDMDGDGRPDLLIGAPLDDYAASNAGAAYMVLSPVIGQVDIADVGAKLVGLTSGDQLGTSVSGGQDLNDDGFDDILAGAPYYDDATTANAGAVHLVFGGGF